MVPCSGPAYFHFNPRSPHGEPPALYRLLKDNKIFQPPLPARGATAATLQPRISRRQFQPTLPARGATRLLALARFSISDFNPRSPHGERPAPPVSQKPTSYFNPRSPHGERPVPLTSASCGRYFNPRSPHGERRLQRRKPDGGADFNPRSPHGERPFQYIRFADIKFISTHAPRTGSDRAQFFPVVPTKHFNPRSPHGERPCPPCGDTQQ